MALNYKLVQSKRNDETKGKWYARASYTSVITIDDLADIMQNNCTVKRSDILAVISELVEVMNDQLKNSHIVKIDRLGSFKIGLSTGGAEAADQWNINKHLKGMHVLFTPVRKKDASIGRYNRAFLSGVKLQEQKFYDVDSSTGDTTDGTSEGE